MKFLKGVISFLLALIMISILTFVLIKLSSNDPAESYLRAAKIPLTEETIKHAKAYLGLNDHIVVQYFNWFFKVLRLDFGQSYLLKESVLPLVLSKFLVTLQLALVSLVFIIVVAFPLGVMSALHKNSWFDKIVQLFSFTVVSIPTFWLGYIGMIIFGVYLKWLPISGRTQPNSVILPSLVLSLGLIGQYISLVRQSMLDELNSMHVKYAVFRGVKQRYIIKNHLLKNSLPILITGLSLTSVYLMTGSIIIEEVFAWNGISSLFVKSVQSSDVPVIQCCMLLFGTLFLTNTTVSRVLLNYLHQEARHDD